MRHVDNLSYKYLIANYLGSVVITFYQLQVFTWAPDPFLWRSEQSSLLAVRIRISAALLKHKLFLFSCS